MNFMIKHLSISILLGLTLCFIGCFGQSKGQVAEKDTVKSKLKVEVNQKAYLQIEGMVCEIGCAKRIETDLKDAIGVGRAEVNFVQEQATILFDSSQIQLSSLIDFVESISDQYKVTQADTKLVERIDPGMD